MKNWEWEFIDNKCWGLGFWFLPGWFGCQAWKYRFVIRKKSEPIEPIVFPINNLEEFVEEQFKSREKAQ